MSANRDNGLWLQFWRDQRTDFHQLAVNQLLTTFWPKLEPAPGSRVFVPLCGKSLDMLWLAAQGHEVLGVELSPVAVQAFFQENGLKPRRRKIGKFIAWEHGNIRILCGDFFALTEADLGLINLVYDRAALTALPEDIRLLYVAHMRLIMPGLVKVLLLTAEDAVALPVPDANLQVDEEIKALYTLNYEINLQHVESVCEIAAETLDQPRLQTEYKVYFLASRDEAGGVGCGEFTNRTCACEGA